MNTSFVDFVRERDRSGDRFCRYYGNLYSCLLDHSSPDTPLEEHGYTLLYSLVTDQWFYNYVERQMKKNNPDLYETYLESVGGVQ